MYAWMLLLLLLVNFHCVFNLKILNKEEIINLKVYKNTSYYNDV